MRDGGSVRIGISGWRGWRYRGWRGVFYPSDLPHKRELEFAASKFPTIEINGTFCSLQRPSSFAQWASQTTEVLKSVTSQDRIHSHWVLRGPAGSEIEWDAEVINDVPNELIAWRSIHCPHLDSAGSISIKLLGIEARFFASFCSTYRRVVCLMRESPRSLAKILKQS